MREPEAARPDAAGRRRVLARPTWATATASGTRRCRRHPCQVRRQRGMLSLIIYLLWRIRAPGRCPVAVRGLECVVLALPAGDPTPFAGDPGVAHFAVHREGERSPGE